MFLVMQITGKVGGATAERLLTHGKEVRALVRNREKAATEHVAGTTPARDVLAAAQTLTRPNSGMDQA